MTIEELKAKFEGLCCVRDSTFMKIVEVLAVSNKEGVSRARVLILLDESYNDAMGIIESVEDDLPISTLEEYRKQNYKEIFEQAYKEALDKFNSYLNK